MSPPSIVVEHCATESWVFSMHSHIIQDRLNIGHTSEVCYGLKMIEFV